jgi:hypothetical protein
MVEPTTKVDTIAAVFVEMVLPINVEKESEPIDKVDADREDTPITMELILLPIILE